MTSFGGASERVGFGGHIAWRYNGGSGTSLQNVHLGGLSLKSRISKRYHRCVSEGLVDQRARASRILQEVDCRMHMEEIEYRPLFLPRKYLGIIYYINFGG